MNITIVGSGYVGLVTGVCLAEVGHNVICIDTNETKINKLKNGVSPIFEPGLEDLLRKNLELGNLHFTTSYIDSYANAEVIIIAVGTPQHQDGSADLSFLYQASLDISKNIQKDAILVIKSTVPVGTNYKIKDFIQNNLLKSVTVEIASNPEFLREGSAIYDMFYPDRIVLGIDNPRTANILVEMYKPFNAKVFKTDIRTSEMIKYASNAFLATKISFINEISNICEKLDANVEDVANGMGLDKRIGQAFLNAGIGYGGSCFPKDTNALVQIASGVEHNFDLLKSVINVNNKQHQLLVDKVLSRFLDLKGKKIALLGLSFKPNTNDMREAPSIVIANKLIKFGAHVMAYDPISTENAKELLPSEVKFAETKEEALYGAEAALIITEWEEFKNMELQSYIQLMIQPIIFDGRNCYSLDDVKSFDIEYHSIGRPVINQLNEALVVKN